MNTLKAWYFACLLFFVHSLSVLIFDEQFEISYLAENRNETEPIDRLACVDLKELQLNQTEIELKELRNKIVDYFRAIRSNSSEGSEGKTAILNRSEAGDFLVFNDRVCFITTPNELNSIHWFLGDQVDRLKMFALKKSTFYSARMSDPTDSIYQAVILNIPHPYSNCAHNNFRFDCLNKCFKRRFRLTRYLYNGSETGSVQLNYNKTNATIQDYEAACFRQCNRDDCKLVYFIVFDFVITTFTEIYQANPMINRLDFWLQLIGLACLLVGTSLGGQLGIAIKLAKSKMRRTKAKIGLVCVKWTILFISSTYFGYLFARMILDHKQQVDHPITKDLGDFIKEPKPVHLAVCIFYLAKYLAEDGQVAVSRNETELDAYIRRVYTRKSLWELELETQSYWNSSLRAIYLDYMGQRTAVGHTVEPKVIFRITKNRLQRCYQLIVYPDEPKNRALFSISKLNVEFQPYLVVHPDLHPDLHLFILVEGEDLNEKSFHFEGKNELMMREVIRSKGTCVNYTETYRDLNCTTRLDCVDRCVQKSLTDKHRNLTVGDGWPPQTIHKSQFSEADWRRFYLSPNKSAYLESKIECEKTILSTNLSCYETEFELASQVDLTGNQQAIEIGLYYGLLSTIEERPSWFKLVLDLVNIQSIFFGLTVFSSLQIIFIQVRLKMKDKRKGKMVWISLFCCTAGFGLHIFHIFSLVISGPLISAQYYEMAEQYRMPIMMFCVQIDQNRIDRNHKLTGNYLEQLTVNITPERMFERVAYLTGLGVWTEFNLKSVDWFYFGNEKCFAIEIDQVYERDQFHFLSEGQVLGLNFSKAFVQKNVVHFMNKLRGKTGYSKVTRLNFEENFKLSGQLPQYAIRQEFFIVKQNDRFYQLKNPLSLFRTELDMNNAHVYLGRLRKDFKKTCGHLATLSLPLVPKFFGQEISDDDLFDQFNRQAAADATSNMNYERRYVINEMKKGATFPNDFTFAFAWFLQVLIIKNEQNYAKLILALLNALSIWLDLGVLDLHPIASRFVRVYVSPKLKQFFVRACRLLLKLERRLSERLDRTDLGSSLKIDRA